MQTEELTITEHPIYVGVPMMDAEMARQLVKNINGRFEWCRRDLLELHDKQGWKALGYNSWGACARAEFGSGAATLYRQLEAAMIERDVLGDSQIENHAPIPTSQLQAVKQLAPEQRVEAFKRADQLAGDKPRTAKHIEQAAAEIAAPEIPDLPLNFAVIQRRLAAHGHILTEQIQGQHRVYSIKREGMTGIAVFDWANVLDRLERMDTNPPPPAGDPLPPKLLALALADLDATLPADLVKAGYFWQSAIPPTIRHNDGWMADAPTVELALDLAYDREKAKATRDRRLPAPIYVKVMDLIGKLSQSVVDAENQYAAKLARAIAILIEQEIAT